MTRADSTLNFESDLVTVGAHADGTYVVEGTERRGDGQPISVLADCN